MDDRAIYAILCRPYLLSACTAKRIADSMKHAVSTDSEHLYTNTHTLLISLSREPIADGPYTPLSTLSVLRI